MLAKPPKINFDENLFSNFGDVSCVRANSQAEGRN
jgi:hypothetical protein